MLPDSYSLLHYLSVFVAPVFQEDAAVLYAAGLATNSTGQWHFIYLTILAGLFLSDIWKYWIGWAALKHPRARAYAERERVSEMGDKVQHYLFNALLVGRFIPLARIPTYVACGYFKVSYVKFCALVAFTGWLYVSIVFTVVHFLGEIVGEKLKWMLPLFALGVLAIVGSAYLIKKRRGRSNTP